MRTRHITTICACLILLLLLASPLAIAAERQFDNTVKQKLLAGKKVAGGTIYTSDPNIYCAMAGAGFDFLWIEMQHSPLTFPQVAAMIRACPDAPASPFIRVPDATEGDIQKATDIGAFGIIVPMVDTVEKAEAAVRFSKYPPQGRRSQGGGQYRTLYGDDYREKANGNIMVIAMIESPDGIKIADQIAAVDGVDVVFAASGDIGSFTSLEQDDPKYQALIKEIHDDVLAKGKWLGGPFRWIGRDGFTFFQASSEAGLIRDGAEQLFKTSKGEYEY